MDQDILAAAMERSAKKLEEDNGVEQDLISEVIDGPSEDSVPPAEEEDILNEGENPEDFGMNTVGKHPIVYDEPEDLEVATSGLVAVVEEEIIEDKPPVKPKVRKTKHRNPAAVRILLNGWYVRDMPGNMSKSLRAGRVLRGNEITERVKTAVRDHETYKDNEGLVSPVVDVIAWE